MEQLESPGSRPMVVLVAGEKLFKCKQHPCGGISEPRCVPDGTYCLDKLEYLFLPPFSMCQMVTRSVCPLLKGQRIRTDKRNENALKMEMLI